MRTLTLEFHPVSEVPEDESYVLVSAHDYTNFILCYYWNGRYENLEEQGSGTDYNVDAIEWAYLPKKEDVKRGGW